MESAAEIKQLEAKIKEDVKQINGACRCGLLLCSFCHCVALCVMLVAMELSLTNCTCARMNG